MEFNAHLAELRTGRLQKRKLERKQKRKAEALAARRAEEEQLGECLPSIITTAVFCLTYEADNDLVSGFSPRCCGGVPTVPPYCD